LNTVKRKHILAILSHIRTRMQEDLRIGTSIIPYDILLVVYDNSLNKNKLTVKALFASLPYSVMGMRYHFNTLIKSGWIELQYTNADARIKLVKPSGKLLYQMDIFLEELQGAFERKLL